MAIDKDVFSAGMGLLANNFNKTIDGALSRTWYLVLSPRMTTAEFEQAVSMSIAGDTFPPSAASLLAKVKADDESKGLLAFEHVNRVLSTSGGVRFLTFDRYHQEFDGPTKEAISAVGGLSAITNTNEDRWPGLRKRFVAAYQAALVPKIADRSESSPVVRQLVRDTARAMHPSGRDLAAGPDR